MDLELLDRSLACRGRKEREERRKRKEKEMKEREMSLGKGWGCYVGLQLELKGPKCP